MLPTFHDQLASRFAAQALQGIELLIETLGASMQSLSLELRQPLVAVPPSVGPLIRECFRYGIEELRIIYGSADRSEGTLRQGVAEAIREASRCVAACFFRNSYGMFAAEEKSTAVRVTLAPNPRPQAQDRKMEFVAFTSRYDTERHRHEPYYPLGSSSKN